MTIYKLIFSLLKYDGLGKPFTILSQLCIKMQYARQSNVSLFLSSSYQNICQMFSVLAFYIVMIHVILCVYVYILLGDVLCELLSHCVLLYFVVTVALETFSLSCMHAHTRIYE